MLRLALILALMMQPAIGCPSDCQCLPERYAIKKPWKYRHPRIWNVLVCEVLGGAGFIIELTGSIMQPVGKAMQHMKVRPEPQIIEEK